MKSGERALLAVVVVLVDLVAFAVPLTAMVVAWVLLTRPPWFRRFVDRLYAEPA